MKAIIADVDDTLCPSTMPVAPAMAAELNRLMAAGKTLAVISGGTFEQLYGQLAQSLSHDFHILAASGTHYVKVNYQAGKASHEEIYKDGFADGQKAQIMAAFEALIEKFQIKPVTSREDQLQDRGSQVTLSAIGRHAPDDQKRAFDLDGSKRKAWVEFLRGILGDVYSMRLGGTSSIDVTPKGRDKAWGIRRFLEIQKLQPSEALYFGDKLDPEGNDFPARSVLDCVRVKDDQHALEIFKNLLPSL